MSHSTRKPGPPRGPDPVARRSALKAARRGRSRQRQSYVDQQAGEFDQHALDVAMARYLARAEAPAAPAPSARPAMRPSLVFPTGNQRRWVPIGPSVVRRGQAEGSPRVVGRIRDLAISTDGTRAYAASPKGGVWYTEDAGSTWTPVGGWADRRASAGGPNNALSCGCLLVSFGASAADDYVMVGTGETMPRLRPFTSKHGGVGVLAGRGAASVAVGGDPWEAQAGIAQLEGLGIFRMARHPGVVPGKATGADADKVLAATSKGAFLGTRSTVAGTPQWAWAQLGGLNALAGLTGGPNPGVTDALWLSTGTANGRMVVAIMGNGVAFSDDLGGTWTWVTNLTSPAAGIVGRMSLANPTGGRVYALGDNGAPTLWQIVDLTVPAPSATAVPGVPANIWGTQRDYDQCIAVDPVTGTDRIYLGGSTVQPIPGSTDWNASLWCFDLPAPPAAIGAGLVASPGISDTAVPGGGISNRAGADQAGLIGNAVHADVHVIRLAGISGVHRQVWVGCDGGVFMSEQQGRCNTFRSRATGLAVLEVGFVAMHPTSSHFCCTGNQDAGSHARQGDTVWEMITGGDGGGTVFHPINSQFVITQYTNATWQGRPRSGYLDPIARSVGGDSVSGAATTRENGASEFYSGAASIRLNATTGRIAVGTERVWISDDLSGSPNNTWRVIGFPNGAARDARPGGGDPAARQTWGVPVTGVGGSLGGVIQLRWAGARHLLALYRLGVVRYTQAAATGQWTAAVVMPGAVNAPAVGGRTVLTDIFPVPETQDFYLTTTGDGATPPGDTCFFFDSATNTFIATGLRHALDSGGVTGPLDPAYAVAVDPANPNDVYAGTVTGVWRSTRAGTAHGAWTALVNGLPQAAIQDLGFWSPAAGDPLPGPRLLRAAVQARGVWEIDLDNDEPQRTYARVHPRDDRRRFLTPMADPRRRPGATAMPVFASPDITVRPAANPAAAPTWQLGTGRITATNAPRYQLWTFQTAFRWLFPAVVADGLWTDLFGDMVELHRVRTGFSPGRFIDRTQWDWVVGGTRLNANGGVTGNPGDPLGVYRAPWQSPAAMAAAATEVDLMETVAPVSESGDVWRTFREPSTVDVLIHHRDVRAVAAAGAFAVLLWRSSASQSTLLSTSAAGLQAYVQSLVTGAPLATPAGWNVVPLPIGGGPPLHRSNVAIDARLPRAVSIDVDFSGVTNNHRVLLMAFVGSDVDGFTAPVTPPTGGGPGNVGDLVRGWAHACMRLIRVSTRP